MSLLYISLEYVVDKITYISLLILLMQKLRKSAMPQIFIKGTPSESLLFSCWRLQVYLLTLAKICKGERSLYICFKSNNFF